MFADSNEIYKLFKLDFNEFEAVYSQLKCFSEELELEALERDVNLCYKVSI
jgi:hypothetical protein